MRPEQQITGIESEPSTVGVPSAPVGAMPTPIMSMPIPVKKKSKKGLIIGLIIAAVVLLGGGGSAFAYYALVYQNPDKVVLDAMTNYMSQKNVVSKVTFETASPINGMTFKITADDQSTDGPTTDMKANIAVSAGTVNLSVDGLVRYTASGDLYFRIENLDKALAEVEKVSGTAPANISTTVDKIQNKWVKISADNLKGFSSQASGVYQCFTTYMSDMSKNNSALTQYKAHPFVVVDKKVDDKNGNPGYHVTLNKDKFKEYYKAMNDTTEMKNFIDCGKKATGSTGSSSSSSSSDVMTQLDKSDVSLDLWIGSWDHQLKSADANYKVSSGNIDYAFKGTATFEYGKAQAPVVPSDSVSVYEWYKDAFGSMNLPLSPASPMTTISNSII